MADVMIKVDWSKARFAKCVSFGGRFGYPMSHCGEPGVLGEVLEHIDKDSKQRETRIVNYCVDHHSFLLSTAFDIDSGRQIKRRYW